MALIKCPQCGKQVSEHALACPKCGLQLSRFAEFNEEQKRIEAERIAKAAEEVRVIKEKREKWWSKNKIKVGIAILIMVIIIVVCSIDLLKTKQNTRMAMSLVEQGDDFANNYQFDQASVCYSEALKIESDDDTKRIIKSRQRWLSSQKAEKNQLKKADANKQH